MTQEEAHELLIRIDERTAMICKSLTEGDQRMKRIEDLQKIRPCTDHEDKLKKLERAMYGTMFGSGLLLILFGLQWAWKMAFGGK